jgi:hypothetical protein
MRQFLIFAILFSAVFLPLSGYDTGTDYFTNRIYDDRVRTVLIHKEGWNLSYPVIKLNSNEKLIFQFDLLDDYNETFYYTFIHCDKDWNRSDIFTNEYLEGFPDNPIEDVQPSFNTTTDYFHYSLVFPNDRISFMLSGNYIIYVYPDGEPDKPVITQRFIITESVAGINFRIIRPQIPLYNNTGQQFEFTVNLTGLSITDPATNIYCSVLQNGRWNNAKTDLKPDFIGNNQLRFNSVSEKNIFNGGNEFRYFDIRSIRYKSEYIRMIDYMAPNYHIFLAPSESREYKPYFYWQDFNGKYYIATSEGREPETDADYVHVYFTLPSDYLIANGNMYVSGTFNNWDFNENNIMIYNPQDRQYECTILLKQGWYNYEYVFLKDGDTRGMPTFFESNHFETENDYSVFVYYRNPYERFDRVIGTVTVNTSNKKSY